MEDAKITASSEPTPSPLQKRTGDASKFCNELIHDFKARADRHKRTFKLLRYSSVSLAIAVTVVSTLTATQGKGLWIVPVVSGFSALCTTLLSATNSQERWVHSRGVQQQLEAEKFLYEQHGGEYGILDEEASVRLFAERIIEIWKEGHLGWAQSVAKASPSSDK